MDKYLYKCILDLGVNCPFKHPAKNYCKRWLASLSLHNGMDKICKKLTGCIGCDYTETDHMLKPAVNGAWVPGMSEAPKYGILHSP